MSETLNSEITIEFYDGLNGTPALDLAMRGWAETYEKGNSDGTLNVFSTLHAFVAYAPNGHDRLPVGVITFEVEKVSNRVWIYQGYTLPEFRGRGVYSAMWNSLVAHGIEQKMKSIQSATHVRNIAMRAVAKKLGRYEESVVLKFDLP